MLWKPLAYRVWSQKGHLAVWFNGSWLFASQNYKSIYVEAYTWQITVHMYVSSKWKSFVSIARYDNVATVLINDNYSWIMDLFVHLASLISEDNLSLADCESNTYVNKYIKKLWTKGTQIRYMKRWSNNVSTYKPIHDKISVNY